MSVVSDKVQYDQEIRSILKCNTKRAIWGEDLYDKKIILFSDKINELKDYKEIRERLEQAILVVVNPRKQFPLECSNVMVDTETGNVFLRVDYFNKHWKDLKKGVLNGIRMAKDRREENVLEKPEMMVDLSNIHRNRSTAIIKKNQISYVSHEMSEEEKLLHAQRQRLLDNRKFLFYYSAEENGVVHDKECEAVKNIKTENLQAAEEYPEGRKMCKSCMRRLLLRKACMPHTKAMPLCDKFCRDSNVETKWIYHFVMTRGFSFEAVSADEMLIHCNEDNWIIKGSPEGKYQLLHNNYVKTSKTARYITTGYHNQGLDGKSVLHMFRYIDEYTWEGHLQAQAMKLQIEQQKAVEMELPEAQIISEFNETRSGRIGKFIIRIKNWWEKIRKNATM